ncbi:cell division protein FtsZ [Thecamonas trahens ATCC 50062]|uniref:Cell division protein FtsZ n=1 Tax=Thecamonas trahens ATCC 50062 TaxID=461836 RepID=A0A0L0DIK3_THETB|nr:cell division protein FtsZ [Thecamonas trahens ATCC 50062]KNC51931.1 cell division protein FtsZ [Thecamonas trahens ATCC 50062]|eukprot:XP_013755526.1 cell division protein FtsZ [Thecamonas trahens ATCC 50062]
MVSSSVVGCGASVLASDAPLAGTNLTPSILVVGVGGGGCNAVNNMISRALTGVDFLACNTDAQSLAQSLAHRTLHLGRTGLGAGASPRAGYDAAAFSYDAIMDELKGNNMVFLTAGMGGGTGTGASPVIAAAARELGILSVGIVTKPFPFEGGRRRRQAEEGISELEKYVDTLLVIPNENLLSLGRNITMGNAFQAADGVLYEGIRGVTDLIVNPGLVNVDFADVTTVMSNKGRALMGSGEAEGDDRASVATAQALANPLLENVNLAHAQGVLVCISGGDDLTLFDVSTTTETIRASVDDDANIIFGSSYDPALPEGTIRVSVMVTGLDPTFKQRVAPAPASAPSKSAIAQGVLTSAAKPAEPTAAKPAASKSRAKPVEISSIGQSVSDNAKSMWAFLKRHA